MFLKSGFEYSTYFGEDDEFDEVELEDVVGEFKDSKALFLDFLEMAPKLLVNSNFLAGLVTSGDSGLFPTFFNKKSELLTAVVMTSAPSFDVTTKTGIETASNPFLPFLWFIMRCSSGPPPSDRVGEGRSVLG